MDAQKRFDKDDMELHILGRTEIDWYIKVNEVTSIKQHKSSTKNFYHCVQLSCLRLRRPCLNDNEIDIISKANISEEIRESVSKKLGVEIRSILS